MASPSGSGTSSGSTLPTTSGSEEDMQQQHAVDLRKQKRKLSNRESARRSRMRKQKHLDDLTAQVAHLRKENSHVLASLKLVTQQYLAMESDNSVLKAQAAELGARLHSLGELLHFLDDADGGLLREDAAQAAVMEYSLHMNPPWSSFPVNQPIMASADMFQY